MIEFRHAQGLSGNIPLAAAAMTVAVAVAVLAGWLLEIAWLRAPIPGQVSMKANTAVGFLLAGGLLAIVARSNSGWWVGVRWTLEALLLLLGSLSLAQYFLGIDWPLDQLLVDAPSDTLPTVAPGRMAPTTALGLMLCALAFIADHWQSGNGRLCSRTCATLMLLLALTSLLGYAYGASWLYQLLGGVTAMALTTAIVFIALAIGIIWLRAAYGFPARLMERSVVGAHLRLLLPMVVAAPLLVGAIVVAGYGHLYQGPTAVALTSLGSVLAAGIVTTVSVIVLRRADNALYIKDRALAAATNGIIITDHRVPDEPVIYSNAAFSDITGYSSDEVLGRRCRIWNEDAENDAQPLQELRHCLEVGLGGKFELQNRHKGGTTFWNQMNLAPIENYEGVVTHFIGVISDVTSQHIQKNQLQQALHDAQAAIAMRDTFVRLISHELRTPLNAALTWLRLMEVDNRPETLSKGLTVIERSIESQSRLVDDLSDITRFQTAGARLKTEIVNIRELVEFTVDELRPMIEPGLTVRVRADKDDYTAELDRLRIQQIVRNLVSNARKYTLPGGCIDVVLTNVDGYLVLSVADTGKGMTQTDLTRVFEPFWRADDNLPGLGVGLAIVAALVAAHKGTIVAESDGPGKGSVFTVRLPRKVPPSDQVPLHEGDQAVLGKPSASTGVGVA